MISELFKTFLADWLNQKDLLDKQMEDNKTWNALYRKNNNLLTKDRAYKKNKRTLEVSQNHIASIIISELPQLLSAKTGLLDIHYKIEGSVGQGMISEIPWICIFDKEITTSAQHGYYLAYLFKSDMSGFYLSLNQGWTQYENEFGVKNGLIEIRKNASIASDLLRSDQGFSYNPIDLKSIHSLGKGYQAGSICSIYYSAEKIPSDEMLVNDLRNLLGVYRELKGLVGLEMLDIKGNLDEEKFQEEIQKGKRKDLKPGAKDKKVKKQTSSSFSWPRDPNMSYMALDNAHFKCENDPSHKTFESAITEHQFVEAHHLIPMGTQDDFDPSIDVPENIISLCPNCHRAFHNSTNSLRKNLISKFYNKRREALQTRKINIELDKLLEYYKVPLMEV